MQEFEFVNSSTGATLSFGEVVKPDKQPSMFKVIIQRMKGAVTLEKTYPDWTLMTVESATNHRVLGGLFKWTTWQLEERYKLKGTELSPKELLFDTIEEVREFLFQPPIDVKNRTRA